MPEFIDMLALPHRQRADHHLIGWRDHGAGAVAIDNAAFRRETDRWQLLLSQHPGHRFALYVQDTIAFSAALFGAWQAGKTVYLPSDALADTCTALAAEVDGFIGDFDAQWHPLQAGSAIADASVTASGASLSLSLPGDFAGLVVYTSGSTGTAQAIPKQLQQMAREVATLDQLFGPRVDQACEVVSTVSHQHIYGLLFKVLWPLASGRPIHARSAFFPEDLAAIAPATRPWLLLASPAHLKRLPESPVQPDKRQLQAVFSSGGPLLPDVSLASQQLFGQVPIEIYGSSETGGIAWRQVDRLAAVIANNTDDSWQPMPHVEVRHNTEHDCLEVRSPHLPDDTWLGMADRVEFRADDPQRFFLRGRADRIVKLEEKRISLDQIERLLLASPLVTEVRVLVHHGSNDGDHNKRDRIAAFVVPSAAGHDVLAQTGKLALNRQLRALLAGAIESVALPRQWRYLDALPANTQGKTTAAALLALLTAPALASPLASAPAPLLPQQRLREHSATRVTLDLHVPRDLLYFRGHFPEAPILPGVVQVDWALTLGRQYFDLPPLCLGMQALKFQRVITPGADVVLELEHDDVKSALAFRLHSPDGQHASGRILLGAA